MILHQKFESAYSPHGPMLEFEVLDDRNNFVDLQKLLLETKCKISRTIDGDIRTGADAAHTDAPFFSNNALTSLFAECTVSANGVKFSITNFHSLKRNFCLEKLQKTHGKCVKDIITRMSDGRADDVVARKALVANSQEKYFIAKPAKNVLNCDKHLLSEVTLQISFRRPTNDFVVISE